MSNVSREADFSTRVAMQVEAKRQGSRKLVRHGGTLCSRCLAEAPARPGGGYCAPCHAANERERRQSLRRRSGEG